MKRLGLLLITCSSFTLVFITQNNIVKSLEHNVPGQSKVSIRQDTRIEALVGSEYIPTGSEDQKVVKSSGYRVQMYAGNNIRQAKNEAYSIASDIKERFPDLPVYTSLDPPHWLCRADDFQSVEEADAMMCQLRTTGVFKEVSITKNQINVPL